MKIDKNTRRDTWFYVYYDCGVRKVIYVISFEPFKAFDSRSSREPLDWSKSKIEDFIKKCIPLQLEKK